MPKVYLNQDNTYRDITEFVSRITWSGGKSEAARKLEISLVNSIIDSSVPVLYVKNGSIIKLFNDDGTMLFMGFVFFNERAGKASTVAVTAYDHLIYTLKSSCVYNFKGKTAEAIAGTLCNDFGIPKWNLISTGISQSFIVNGKSPYDVMMQGYKGASKQNGKQYLPRMNNGKLDVIEIGKTISKFSLSDMTNITDSGYSESIENMVNKVKIYDSKGNCIGEQVNAEWLKKYGVLQEVYTKEKDKNPNTVAKEMLKDVEKTATIEALGDVTCISGNGVQVEDGNSGLKGLFYIDSDNHTWQNGQHIMRLKLNFKNMM